MELQEPVHGSASGRFVVEQIAAVDTTAELARDVLAGLSARPKRLPTKYFYDEHGSWLYDKICQVPEYYPARIEEALLVEKSIEIIEATRPDTILELGSGTSRKTTHLLNACEALHCHADYLPLDVCEEMLRDAGKRLIGCYDWLKVRALVGDYSEGFHNVPRGEGTRLYVFLGGTLGNLDEVESIRFLRRLHAMMDENDYLLLGVDRVKEVDVLNAAYNDSQGYTAAFNRNVLSVINRELGGHFNTDTFAHRAWFNEEKSQIEMHLHSTRCQRVRIDALDTEIPFERDESIQTEISRKFTLPSLKSQVATTGFSIIEHYEPSNGYFSLVLLNTANSMRTADK